MNIITDQNGGDMADLDTVRQWLTAYYRDAPGRISIASTGDWSGRSFTDIGEAVDYVGQLDALGRQGIYARATTLAAPLEAGKRGGAADSLALPGLWSDIDIAGPGHKTKEQLPRDTDEAVRIVEATGLPEPTAWVHSGGGMYAWWWFDPIALVGEDAELLDRAKALSIRWQAALGKAAESLGLSYGTGVSDLARVLRIPGTINRKPGCNQQAMLVTSDGPTYTFDQLEAAAADLEILREPEKPARPTTSTTSSTPSVPKQRTTSDPGPFDVLSEAATWADLFEPEGWALVGTEGDGAELWQRPGGTSEYSARCGHNGVPVAVIHSESAGLPSGAGQHLTKGRVFAHLNHNGDASAAAKDLLAAAAGRPEASAAARSLPVPVLEAIRQQCHADEPRPPRQAEADLLVNVTNAAITAGWLRYAIGTGPLAGMFLRGGSLVYTPRIGEQGYVPLRDGEDADGPAQVRPVTKDSLTARIQYTYEVIKTSVDDEGEEVRTPAMFPASVANLAVSAPDLLPNLRHLRGVIHSPVVRPDGSVITAPGYDQQTDLLYLPPAGLTVPEVPESPTGEQVAAAVALLDEMVADFRFVTAHDRSNYYGLLLTPLLRAMVPPPYKLGAIGAPQPGSGKTLLANIMRSVHGGVFRSEIPGDDAELKKQITSILAVTTGPVVTFDNVTGVLRSSTLAGLLTSARWDDRLLGSTNMVQLPNDRMWVVTGNNVVLGGDLPRRTVWVTIDPAVPDPHLRTGFKIPNLEAWAGDRRGVLLAALLTLVRHWVALGRPTTKRSADSFGRWIEAVEGILTAAGIEGGFDHSGSVKQGTGTDDEEWAEFLAAVQRVYGDRTWTVREVLDQVDISSGGLTGPGWEESHPISLEALPTELADKIGRSGNPRSVAKSLGRWLMNRDGRWANRTTVRAAGTDRKAVKLWRIEAAAPLGTGSVPGLESASDSKPGTPKPGITRENPSSAGFAGFTPRSARKSENDLDAPLQKLGEWPDNPANPSNPALSKPGGALASQPDGTCGGCGWPLDSIAHGEICATS